MDRSTAIDRLPEAYAAALRLREEGHDDSGIAARLDLASAAVGPLLRALVPGHHTPAAATVQMRGNDQPTLVHQVLAVLVPQPLNRARRAHHGIRRFKCLSFTRYACSLGRS
jgi:hypothetical protein